MFKRLDHVELVVEDLDRTATFYVDVLGFEERYRSTVPTPDGKLDLCYLDLGGTTIELLRFHDVTLKPKPAFEHVGYRLIALEVDDMDRALAYLKEKGVACVWGPRTIPGKYARAEIQDPAGNHIELRHWTDPTLRAR
jgi:glyoxylase I family protein